jgi:hypothetical protein
MGKTSKSRYDEFEIEEIRHARLNRRKQPIKDRSSERRAKRALKTKNIDEYLQYNENEEDSKD